MRISLIAIGDRMPKWVNDAVADYIARYPREWHFSLNTLPPAARHKSRTTAEILDIEGDKLLRAAQHHSLLIALDERGECLTSRQFSLQLSQWQTQSEAVAFLIGGADGLSSRCREAAHQTWSLSSLTFPHAIARLILVEQLYRAWSLLANHPYHRD